MANNPIVSVVITTKNEEKNIGACLKSIYHQTYPQDRIEIIVVDNNSTDDTKTIARTYTDHVFNKGPERSVQRNFGASKSHGAYYLYLDADMTLSPSVIAEAVLMMEQDNSLVGLYIPEIVQGDSFWSRVRRFERSFYDATSIDCSRFIRMSAFRYVKGFDESMSGPEDWDFDKKLKERGKVSIIASPVYHNEANFRISTYLGKKQYYAKSFATYCAKWGADDPDIKQQLGFNYRFFGVFIEKGRWKKLVAHPILTMGMYSLRFLVGISYLLVK
jgi:glycosyltransferase involved in cell wall biosynthesis